MRLSWQYIAGFFDGEGCITTSTGMSIRVTIAQTGDKGLKILTLIQDYVALRGIKAKVNSKRVYSERHSPSWSLVMSETTSCIAFLQGVIPYLHVKKVLAEDKVRFLTWYATNRRYQKAIARCNRIDYNQSPQGIANAKKPNAGQFKLGHFPQRWLKHKENQHVQ